MEPILVDGVYEHLVGYRDTILKQHRWLCGDEIKHSAATDSWQIYAANMATTLRNYARLLEALGNGTLGFNGPVVFPSWDDGSEPRNPELLAALKAIVKSVDNREDDYYPGLSSAMLMAEEAIRKAEGGAS